MRNNLETLSTEELEALIPTLPINQRGEYVQHLRRRYSPLLRAKNQNLETHS